MKIKYLAISIFSLFSLIACNNKKEQKKDSGIDLGQLKLSKKYPTPGDTLKVSYDGKINNKAYYLYQVGTNTHAKEFSFNNTANTFQANIKIPDSATAIIFALKDKRKLLHNDHQGYSTLLYTKNNDLINNTLASKASLYNTYKNKLNLQPETDSLLFWLKKEFKKNPSAEDHWDRLYFEILNKKNKTNATSYAKDRISIYEAKNNPSEKTTTKLISFYDLLGEEERANTLKKEAFKKYPLGETAKSEYVEQVKQTEELEKKIYLYKSLNEQFESSNIKKENTRILSQIALEYAKLGDWNNFFNYSSKIPNLPAMASLYNSVAWDKAEKGKDLTEVKKLSTKSLSLLEAEKQKLNSKPTDVTETEYKLQLSYYYQNYADTYAYILNQLGEKEEAIKYAKIAVGKGQDTKINERMVQILIEANKFKEAENIANSFIIKNQANSQIKDYYKKAYLKIHKSSSEIDFKRDLAKLESEAKQNFLEKLKAEKINEPAPDFTLLDIEKNKVKLSKLKGKTVVLDFWANWCGPCKASFPGMEKFIEKYKTNDNIEILFINTFENEKMEERYEKSLQFLKENDYPFEVLFDENIQNSRDFKVAQDYGISAIPTKVIIDPEGNINFIKVGFTNNEQMIDELEMMIELAQQ